MIAGVGADVAVDGVAGEDSLAGGRASLDVLVTTGAGLVTVTVAPGIVTVTFAVAVAWIVTVFAGSSDDTGEVAGTEAASEGTLFDDCAARTGVVLRMVVVGSEAD